MTTPTTFLEQVNQLIDTHPNHPQLLSLIAEHFQLSPSQIYRKIKSRTGLSPSHYIRQRRLSLAQSLILKTDLSFSEIARLTGFRQLAYFSRSFAKHFGMTASRMRQQRKNHQINGNPTNG